MPDTETTVAQLRQMVEEFVSRGTGTSFHAPKNLAMSLAVEAAELMEHFQCFRSSSPVRWPPNRRSSPRVADEMADVVLLPPGDGQLSCGSTSDGHRGQDGQTNGSIPRKSTRPLRPERSQPGRARLTRPLTPYPLPSTMQAGT